MEVVEREDQVPLWRIAATHILERYNEQGYGITFTRGELERWMGMSPPRTPQEQAKNQLDWLVGTQKIQDYLLANHQLCFYSNRGVGFSLLPPKQQIRKAADAYLDSSRRKQNKALEILTEVNVNELSHEDIQLRTDKVRRVLFRQAAARKRVIPEIVKLRLPLKQN